jgi:HPt (histidine-containing phosphotransfer) domain-containing protein
MAEDQVLDPAAIARLREWGGTALPKKMIEVFMQTTPERMDQVREGVEDGDLKKAEMGAHTLKSSAGNVGAVPLQKAAQLAETLAEEEKLEALRDHLVVLEERYGAATEALRSLLEGMMR